MSTEHAKAVVRRFVDGYQTGGDEAVFDASIHADFVDHSRPPGIAEGPEGVRQQFDGFRGAFDGFRATILHQVAEGDLVVTRKVFHGTHTGPFLGLAPTGRDVEIMVIDMVRVRDDRIAEHWNVVDVFGLLAQLGQDPQAAAAATAAAPMAATSSSSVT
jgi:predicted ester cyclase